MNKKTSNANRAVKERAIKEAQTRRKKYLVDEKAQEKEIGGRKGLNPTRYGDWEKKGIVSDF
ncbi:MAG: DUF1674 domain-containing protein [Devosiaceae bacterium]|nr:DUF1674 domain-containing protein [Devosiaceae bacterium]